MANRSTGVIPLTVDQYTNYKCPLCKNNDEFKYIASSSCGTVRTFKCETELAYGGYVPHYWVDIHLDGPKHKIAIRKEIFVYFDPCALTGSYSATLYLSDNDSTRMCVLNNWNKNQQAFLKFIPSWDFTNEEEMINHFTKRWRNIMLLK